MNFDVMSPIQDGKNTIYEIESRVSFQIVCDQISKRLRRRRRHLLPQPRQLRREIVFVAVTDCSKCDEELGRVVDASHLKMSSSL